MIAIGTGTNVILGLSGLAFWGVAFTWYFLGVHRVNRVMGRLARRLRHPFKGPEPPAPPPAARRPRRGETRRPAPPG